MSQFCALLLGVWVGMDGTELTIRWVRRLWRARRLALPRARVLP